MKRQLLYFIAFIPSFVLFIGCEKVGDIDQAPVDETLYNVRFSVNSFSVDDDPLGKVAVAKKKSTSSINTQAAVQQTFNAVQDYLNLLEYFIYDETGQLVRHISQDKSFVSPSPISYYGETALQLKKGNYKIVVIGTLTPLKFGNTKQFSTAYLSPSIYVEDIFFKVVDFTVTGDADKLETISIERIVASLEVNETESVTDLWGEVPQISYETVARYPFDASKKCTYTNGFLSLVSGELALWKTVTFISTGYVLPDRSDHFNPNVYITIPGQGFNQVASKNFDDLVIKPNRKLTLTGTLTGKYQNQHVDIVADSAWLEHKTVEFKPD